MSQGPCNTRSKIAFCIATVLGLIGVILMFVSFSATGSLDITWIAEQATDFDLTIDAGSCQMDFYVRQDVDCGQAYRDVDLRDPSGNYDRHFINVCGGVYDDSWTDDYDPKLYYMASLNADTSSQDPYGTYSVNSQQELWVHDWCESIDDIVSGFLALLFVFVIGLILLIVCSILCCVGCCCMTPAPKPAANPVVGQVVGHPIGSA